MPNPFIYLRQVRRNVRELTWFLPTNYVQLTYIPHNTNVFTIPLLTCLDLPFLPCTFLLWELRYFVVCSYLSLPLVIGVETSFQSKFETRSEKSLPVAVLYPSLFYASIPIIMWLVLTYKYLSDAHYCWNKYPILTPVIILSLESGFIILWNLLPCMCNTRT